MPGSKIVDHNEVRDWFDEGWTYQQMIDTYREKYSIETTIAMWGNYRRRRGIQPRNVWDAALLPWKVRPDHAGFNPAAMLRKVARQRAGAPVSERVEREIAGWLKTLERNDWVVHYDADTDEGFFYVPRRKGIDLDLIREPGRIERRLPEE